MHNWSWKQEAAFWLLLHMRSIAAVLTVLLLVAVIFALRWAWRWLRRKAASGGEVG